MVIRIAVFILIFPALARAQTHVVGYGGALSRLQANRLNLASFRSGPASTISPVLGAGGGTSIWRVQLDGAVLWAMTGEKEVFIGANRRIEQKARGSNLMMDAGAGWVLFKIFGFKTVGRGGYGLTRVRVSTDIPIEDDRHFWNYGIAATRKVGTRYFLRIDVRNVHFRREEVPQTLGRFNVVALTGFGFRFHK